MMGEQVVRALDERKAETEAVRAREAKERRNKYK
jgi:hypothetical protein